MPTGISIFAEKCYNKSNRLHYCGRRVN